MHQIGAMGAYVADPSVGNGDGGGDAQQELRTTVA